jgi:hypothetical protein
VALFVIAIVALVVAQTWMDWRDAKRKWVVPDWAKGMALAGAVAASLTGLASYASYWLGDPASQMGDPLHSGVFWPELAFAGFAMAVIVLGIRTKRLRLMLLVTAVLTVAFWMGMSL